VGVEEKEPDQTDEIATSEAVEVGALREVRNENLRVYLVVEQREVSPIRRQERARQ